MKQRVTHSVKVGLLLVSVCVGLPAAQAEQLGELNFPTSGSAAAQEHFLRGVKYLHNFGFEDAAAAFQAAAKAEPDFALAYWGEALSHNHPLQPARDLETPRSVLARLGASPAERAAKAPTPREAGLLAAVEILYGEGEAAERASAYAEAMGRLAAQYPEDEELQAFYAVALLGTVRHLGDSWGAESTFRVRMKAGAIAQEVFRTHPNHPGAAHYIIHAFDDPVHAPLALTAAERYAHIAPDVSHALHMPSHIFIQRGMWAKVVASNDASYHAAFAKWPQRDSFSETQRYFNDVYIWHALDWGQYGALQQADWAKAKQAIELLRPVAEKSSVRWVKEGVGEMTARAIVESEQWQQLPLTSDLTAHELMATGMSAVRLGDVASAQQAEAKLRALEQEEPPSRSKHRQQALTIMRLEVAALVRLAQGQGDAAVARMDEAVALANRLGLPNGAAIPIKPAHELYGEILLELGQPQKALTQFETSLQRTPNRRLSLRGLARAAAKSGDLSTARHGYQKLLVIRANNNAPEALQEARIFLDTAEQ